jgi:plasmid replication initiation protein
MLGNRTPRATLPVPLLEIDLQYEPEALARVKQHWAATFAHQRKISVYGKRIMARVMEQIKEDDLQLREYYQLRIASLVEGTDIDVVAAYSFVKKALYELAHITWEFESLDSNEWYTRHLLDTTKERRVGVKDGIITIILNPQLAPYFVQIAGQYSTYKLDGYMNLHSWYSMRFFEILSAFRDTGWWEVSVDEYRLLMDCGPETDRWGAPKKDKKGSPVMKYDDTNVLIKKTVLTAQKELEQTPCAFTYSLVLEASRTGRGRKKITGLRFELLHKQPTVIPASWLTDTILRPTIDRLREFKVTDRNIALYLKAMDVSEARKLVREWQLKENSQKKIDDKQKYCNAVFVRVGKQIMDQKKKDALSARQVVQAALAFTNEQ